MTAGRALATLLAEIRACTVCAEDLPEGPRPVLQAGSTARIVIVGQAPGRRVHQSGVPWDDPSGQRLREWLGLSAEQFYDPDRVAIVPMGFCYPGSTKAGDRPPRPECAPLWHERLLDLLPDDRLHVIIGTYAQSRYIADRGKTVSATVGNWARYLPDRAVMPHPSPRNRNWLTRNPWFETEAVPAIQQRIQEVLGGGSDDDRVD